MKKPAKQPSRAEKAALQSVATTYYRPEGTQSQKTAAKPPINTVSRTEGRKNIKKTIINWITVFFVVAALAFAGLIAWDVVNFSRASAKLFGSPNVLGALFTTPLKLTPEGRVNILLVGYSADDTGHAGAELTDSILIMSLRPSDRTGYMLSIPRDLLVDIPDYGVAKINETYQAGKNAAYPSGGLGLLREVINDHFAIKTQYHALINYAAVRETVDALGGVTVTIDSDDPRGLYDPNFQAHEGGPLELANGTQTIDGVTALQLTRARGAAGNAIGFAQSDFIRTKHQQMVASAIMDQVTWKILLDPRTNSAIFTAVADNVSTDVRLSETLPLGMLMMETPPQSLQSLSLRELNGQNLLTGYTTRSGQSALIPRAGIYDFSEIQEALQSYN